MPPPSVVDVCRVSVAVIAGLLSLVGGDVDERALVVAVDHASPNYKDSTWNPGLEWP
jgi:hypothetical protein